MSSDRKQTYERFVPQGSASLAEDAPGWGDKEQQVESTSGPMCWKCRGNGAIKPKKTKGVSPEPSIDRTCPVCKGRGRLAPKRKEVDGASKPGTITRGRKRPDGWTPSGPVPHALTLTNKWTDLVKQANRGEDVSIPNNDDDDEAPGWMPRQGEELCNLVGSWRILQRVGSHRWTTDDLVTAYVAAQEIADTSMDTVRYLDLGTGNASVLQMVTWAMLKEGLAVDATGVEARLEAVQLARRSLSFNVGSEMAWARIIHGDFRDANLQDESFHLITGTPPYFRVDFAVNEKNDEVLSAVINQGGMPTARQSAPARCEFRGGIEAYCQAASRFLCPRTGRFVVCENWLNHERVLAAAEQYKLYISKQVYVKGRQGRDTLFCVYVMKTRDGDLPSTKLESMDVRDHEGNWTKMYQQSVLEAMSIPDPSAFHRSNNENRGHD